MNRASVPGWVPGCARAGRVVVPARWRLGVLASLLVAGVLAPRAAEAVPVFARRYGTSCQTCHVVFPRLTPFGESFRRSGYRFPDGADEDYRRQEPLSLGAGAYRDLFPRAVWPGEMPGTVPLSVFMSASAGWSQADPARVSFASLAGTVRLSAAANLGEHFTAWAGVNFDASSGTGEAAVSFERAFLAINPFRRPHVAFRVGLFEPALFSFSSHRLPGPMPWILTSPVRDNRYTPEPTQLGIEATGVALAGRGAWTLGFVEGAGNQFNLPKDAYARVAFKLGGLRLDGAGAGDASLSNPNPWHEWSVTVGGFGYLGHATIGNPAVASQDDRFFLAGGDVHAHLGHWMLLAAYSQGMNTRPSLLNPAQAATSHHLMAQVDWVLLPWLIPGVRAEQAYLDGQARTRLVGQVYALVRANIRTSVTAIFEQPVAGTFGFTALLANLALGF